MSIDNELEQVEISIDTAKKTIEKMKAFNRLVDNKDFKTIIEEGYFKEEASRIVMLKADPNMQEEQYQKQLDASIIAIGYLRQYFVTINQLGRMAQNSLESDQQTREELLAEAV